MPDFKAIISAEISRPRPLVPASGQSPVAGIRTRPGRLAETRPLPDAACICPVAIPSAAPPYDTVLARGDTLLTGGHPRTPDGPEPPAVLVRGDTPLTGSHPRSPDGPEPPVLARGDTLLTGGHPRTPDGPEPPAGGSWPSRFAQALAETLAGSRPPEQIAAWTTERARKRISQLGPLMATTHRPRVRRVLVASPASGVLEMTVIVGVGPQVRALAVRLERADQLRPDTQGQPGHAQSAARWRCTAVDAA